jgi:hypothetical protein
VDGRIPDAHLGDDGPVRAVGIGGDPVSLSPEQVVTLTEVLMILMGIGITWAVYHGSEKAELPGDATIPDPLEVDDVVSDPSGRTL